MKYNTYPLELQEQFYKPLLDIDFINSPGVTLFYAIAWMLIPPLYNNRLSKSKNRKIVSDYVRKFRTQAAFAGIKIGRGAILQYVFTYLQRSLERSIPERAKARDLMATYLNAQYGEGAK